MGRDQYVKSGTAKLLREKGFRGDCIAYYNDDSKRYLSLNADLHPLPCPTQAVACRWLREVHKIDISVIPDDGSWSRAHAATRQAIGSRRIVWSGAVRADHGCGYRP